MEFNNDNAAVCPGTIDGSTGEIDLYDALAAFTDLAPAEKQRLVEVAEKPLAGTKAPEKDDQRLSTDPLPAPASIKPAEPEETLAAADFPSNGDPDLNTSPAPTEAHPELQWAGPSGPLGSLTQGFVFKGALSGGICIACGAESGTDELFCIACGLFIE
jgi:hypothetical protein